MADDAKAQARQAFTNLHQTMQKVLGLPDTFGIRLTDELESWFNSEDREKLERFAKWANDSAAMLK